jgi:large subunit ribosomal protein L24
MKKEYSKKWKGSKQPRKQRKYLANAPLHIKRKQLSVNLSKDLRKKHSTRNVVVRVKDKVKIMRGKFKKKEGKVTKVNIKQLKVYVEGIQTKKQDGSMADVALRPSNLQIIELYTEDKKRFKTKQEKPKKEEKSVNKKEKENKK